MKLHTKGIIARFREVSSVRTQDRRELCARTQNQYITYLKKFWLWSGKKPAMEWGGVDVERFLVWMRREQYSRSARKTALCALVFVFKHVLVRDLGTLNLPAMPKEKRTIKIIPSRAELNQIFNLLRGMIRLMGRLMYGSGVRVGECCRVRVKDIDIEARTIRVYDGKGEKNRLCLLPVSLIPDIERQIAWRKALHEQDLADGAGVVDLPGRYGIKNKSASTDLRWQYLFPSAVVRGDHRWHTTEKAVQDAVAVAVKKAGIFKIVTPHTFRHAYCTHSQQIGNDIATVSELMGHESIETTQLYSHADAAHGTSPLDVLPGNVVPFRREEQSGENRAERRLA